MFVNKHLPYWDLRYLKIKALGLYHFIRGFGLDHWAHK